ncbi:MAG: FG-GAP repeat protein, partial [Planctomycetaceae bacterium]|nr:FG-GAP repeat protein [Planctomycetaceae bacterium]
ILDLGSLNGSNGFRIDGAAGGQFSGTPLDSAGDVNGDGIDDLLVGARPSSAGRGAYVIYGRTSSFPAVLALADLNGSDGFQIQGRIDGVSAAGDVNGDGFDDLIVASEEAATNVTGSYSTAFVVFGAASAASAVLNLVDLDGSNGFRINGEPVHFHDYLPLAVDAAGDLDGD